jgi:RimJ/RimL family protein N-acetyltransferase
MLSGVYTGLRAIEESDLSILLSWRNEPTLRRYFREYRELNSTQQREWFNDVVNGHQNTKMFSIVDLSSQKLIGACGLCHIDWINRSADFSIYIGEHLVYLDKVWAPDAAKLLMSYAYDQLGIHRLWAEVYEFDKRKIDFFYSLGFLLDGKHRQTLWHDSVWHDSWFFSHLRLNLGDSSFDSSV